VYTPEKIDLSDPKYLHVLKCAECTRELIELRRLRNEQSARAKVGVPARPSSAANWRWAVAASVVLCFFVVAGVIYWRIHSEGAPAKVAQLIPVVVTIDLSQAGTTQGTDTTTAPLVVLPRRIDSAHVILPNFSPGGNYVVSITPNQSRAAETDTVPKTHIGGGMLVADADGTEPIGSRISFRLIRSNFHLMGKPRRSFEGSLFVRQGKFCSHREMHFVDTNSRGPQNEESEVILARPEKPQSYGFLRTNQWGRCL
jgi:hypothetical protein